MLKSLVSSKASTGVGKVTLCHLNCDGSLTSILKEKSTLPDFYFQGRCEQNKLITLCYADDLMIFCKGIPIDLSLSALLEFETLSGLSSRVLVQAKE